MRQCICPDQPVGHDPQVIIGAKIYFPLRQPQPPQRILLPPFIQLAIQKVIRYNFVRPMVRISGKRTQIPEIRRVCVMEIAPEHHMETTPGQQMETTSGQKNILGLQLPTDPRWVNLAADLPGRYPHRSRLVRTEGRHQLHLRSSPGLRHLPTPGRGALAPIVTEEWGHFRLVLAENCKKEVSGWDPNEKTYTVNSKLREFEHKGGGEEQERFSPDRLLVLRPYRSPKLRAVQTAQ